MASHRLTRLANGAIGAVVAAYAFLDDLLLGPPLVVAAVFLPWPLVFGAATGLFTLVNVASCDWLQRRWTTWIAGHGATVEAMLERRRRSRILRHPIRWITRDSDIWVTIAAGLIGTVIVIAVIRLLGGAAVGPRRLILASIAYSAGFAATYTGVGIGLHDLL